MKGVLLLIVTSFILCGRLSRGYLVDKPKDTVFWYCDNIPDTYHIYVSLNCSSSNGSGAIMWYFTKMSSATRKTVAVGKSVDPSYADIFWIDQPNSMASNLVLVQSSNITAGTYTCSDNTTSASAKFAAYMSVYPIVTSNMSSSDYISGERILHSYRGCIYGNIFPQISVALPFQDHPRFLNYGYRQVTMAGYRWLKCFDVEVYEWARCGAMFKGVQYNISFIGAKWYLPSVTFENARNISGFNFTISYSSPINVTCVPSVNDMTITGLAAENAAFLGSELTCNATSDFPVTYIWADDTYGNYTRGQSITVWHNGTFRCTASATCNRKLYMGSKTLNNLLVIRKPQC